MRCSAHRAPSSLRRDVHGWCERPLRHCAACACARRSRDGIPRMRMCRVCMLRPHAAPTCCGSQLTLWHTTHRLDRTVNCTGYSSSRASRHRSDTHFSSTRSASSPQSRCADATESHGVHAACTHIPSSLRRTRSTRHLVYSQTLSLAN